MSGEPFAGWAIVELMGHRQRAGEVREVEMFGARLLRVDTPTAGEPVTEFYGGGAIYAVRPCTEDVARAMAARLGDPRPVSPLAYRLAAPEPEFDAEPTFDDLADNAWGAD